MITADHYAYRVSWSTDDNGYIGTAAEWPSLSWADEAPTAAFAGIERLVTDALADMAETGETAPTPFADASTPERFR